MCAGGSSQQRMDRIRQNSMVHSCCRWFLGVLFNQKILLPKMRQCLRPKSPRNRRRPSSQRDKLDGWSGLRLKGRAHSAQCDHGFKSVHGLNHEAPSRIGRRPSSPETNSMAGWVCVREERLFLRSCHYGLQSVNVPKHASDKEEEH